MEEQDLWEGAKTSAMMMGGVIFAFAMIIGLDRYGYIDAGIELDPQLLSFLFGVLMVAGLATFFMDRIEWI